MADTNQDNTTLTPDAMYFKREDGKLQCAVCAHACALREGQRGICHVRERRGDAIVSLVYGRVVAEHIDPIEKKPLFHVLPGSFSYSISTLGCNFRCLHCQNASISQVPRDMDLSNSGVYRHPKTIVASAIENDCQSISYTYVEPTIFFEYAYDCAVAAADKGLKNIFVSNGYMSDAASRILAPVLTAINIDLKSFSDAFYKKVCGARLAPVLDSIARFKELGVWVEVTTLIIPGMNDSEQELNEIASFLVGIDRRIPWHVTGFYPSHKMMDVPPTGGAILVRAREIGFAQGLEYVYTGNRPEVVGENTSCPSCKKTVISRHGFQVTANRLQNGCCPHCGSVIPGVWQ
ncbi:AmmeMemoRadiSam system radical SAM enzyme [Desulfocastanea catecholica]